MRETKLDDLGLEDHTVEVELPAVAQALIFDVKKVPTARLPAPNPQDIAYLSPSRLYVTH